MGDRSCTLDNSLVSTEPGYRYIEHRTWLWIYRDRLLKWSHLKVSWGSPLTMKLMKSVSYGLGNTWAR